MKKTLFEMVTGETGHVDSINGDIHIKRRLYELGIFDGECIKVLSVSPLKKSFLVSVKGYTLALRESTLKNIVVEVV